VEGCRNGGCGWRDVEIGCGWRDVEMGGVGGGM